MEDTKLDDVVKQISKNKDYGKLGADDEDDGCIFGLSGEVLKRFEFKKLLILLVILIIVHSSIYLERVLHQIDGSTLGLAITSKGSLIQIGSVVSAFAILNFLVNTKIL